MRSNPRGDFSAKVQAGHRLSIQEAITSTVHRSQRPDGSDVTPQEIAERMNLPLGTLYDIADQQRTRELRAREVPGLVLATNNHLIPDVIETRIGRVAYLLPTALGQGPLLEKAANAVREFGELLQELHQAIADGRMTLDEAEQVSKEGLEVIAAVQELMAQSKEMAIHASPIQMAAAR